jgi:hypothetical protein
MWPKIAAGSPRINVPGSTVRRAHAPGVLLATAATHQDWIFPAIRGHYGSAERHTNLAVAVAESGCWLALMCCSGTGLGEGSDGTGETRDDAVRGSMKRREGFSSPVLAIQPPRRAMEVPRWQASAPRGKMEGTPDSADAPLPHVEPPELPGEEPRPPMEDPGTPAELPDPRVGAPLNPRELPDEDWEKLIA